MEKLRWLFELVDRMTAPAKAISGAIDKVEGALKRVKSGLDEIKENLGLTEEKLGKQQRSWLSLGGALDLAKSGLFAVVDIAESAIEKFVSLTYQVAELAVEAASFREQSLISLEAFTGSAGKAKQLYEQIDVIAKKLPFATEQVQGWAQELLASGFKFNPDEFGRSEVSVLTQTVADMASAMKLDPAVAETFIRTFSKIRSGSEVTRKELESLQQNGLNLPKFYEAYGQEVGQSADAVQKLVAAGKKLDSEKSLRAMVDTIRDTVDKGVIGGASLRQMDTFAGLLARIKSAPFNLFEHLSDSGGFSKLKGAMGALATALDPSSPAGARIERRLTQFFDGLFGGIFGDLSGPDAAGKIADFIVHAVDVFEAGWKAIMEVVGAGVDAVEGYLAKLGGGDLSKGIAVFFQKLTDWIGQMGGILARTVPLVQQILDLIDKAVGAWKWFFQNQYGDQADARQAVEQKAGFQVSKGDTFDPATAQMAGDLLYVQGQYQMAQLVAGMQAGVQMNEDQLRATMEDFAEKVNAPIKAALGIHSPSTVFQHFGLMVSRGFAQGIAGGADEVGGAVDAGLVLPATSPALTLTQLGAGGGGTGGRGSAMVNVTVNLAPGSSVGPAELDAVRQAAREGVAAGLEQLGLELGEVS